MYQNELKKIGWKGTNNHQKYVFRTKILKFYFFLNFYHDNKNYIHNLIKITQKKNQNKKQKKVEKKRLEKCGTTKSRNWMK